MSLRKQPAVDGYASERKFDLMRVVAALVFPAVILLGLVFAYVKSRGVVPECQIHSLTGIYCPGCGGSRSLKALLKGDVLAALQMNAFALGFMGVAGYLALRTSWEAWFPMKRWPRFSISPKVWWTIGVMVFLYVIARNLPWEPFNSLAPKS